MLRLAPPRVTGLAAAAGLLLAAGFASAQEAQPIPDPIFGSSSGSDGQTADPATDVVVPPAPPQPRLTIAPEDDPPPRRRPQINADPYAPPGLRLGGIILHPSLTIGGVITSNVQQAPSNPKSDEGLSLKPSLEFASDWSRHSWSGRASANFLRYLRNPGLKADTADAGTTFRLDIRHDTFATFDAGYSLSRTGLGNSQIPANAIGTRADQVVTAAAGLTHDYGPMQTAVRAGVAYNTYGSVKLSGGGSQSNADRDNLAPSLTLRATYSDPPVFKPYVETSYEPRIYDQRRDRAGFQRSSQGGAVSAGVAIDDSPIWRGEVAVTARARDYDDPALSSVAAFGLTGSLIWSPTELTTIVLGLGTDLSDNVGTGSSADRVWSAKLAGAHALRDNISLLAGASVSFDQTTSGYDKTVTGNLGLEWRLGPSLAWTAAYDVAWLAAAQNSRDYTEHRVSIGLTVGR